MIKDFKHKGLSRFLRPARPQASTLNMQKNYDSGWQLFMRLSLSAISIAPATDCMPYKVPDMDNGQLRFRATGVSPLNLSMEMLTSSIMRIITDEHA